MPRQTEEVRAAAATRVQALLEGVAAALPPGHPEGAAAAVASHLVGALQLARALGNNALGRRHLATARRFLLDQFESAPPTRR